MEKEVKCAIYTRKSTDEGLDKEFNTLEAQREAGLDYIKSHKWEGWVALDEQYDDGGFSGGNIERPALKRLMSDIAAGKVDMVVIYKIDRLSRSLMDFAKLMEVFDNHKVSFVSVTQNFNTSDPMGRLMLNVLLSFAQFEREVGTERVRDKILASKKKGMWMGGTIPLGYDAIDKKLIINEEEAKMVRFMYEYYLLSRSEKAVTNALNEKGWRTKIKKTKNGIQGGTPFKHNTINNILRNQTYIGKVVHKGIVYEGQHEAIISQELFDKVQELKKTNIHGKFEPTRPHSSALLKGLIRCGCCNAAMVVTSCKKKNIVYEYYTSCVAVRDGYDLCKVGSLPTREVDAFIKNKLERLFDSPLFLKELLPEIKKSWPNMEERAILAKIKDINGLLNNLPQQTVKLIMSFFIKSITIYPTKFMIRFTPLAVKLMDTAFKSSLIGDEQDTMESFVTFGRRHGRVKIIAPDGETFKPEENSLQQAIVRAFKWRHDMSKHKLTIEQLAQRDNIGRGYIGKVLHLTYLAPDIIERIMAGDYPKKLSSTIVEQRIPDLWQEQREKFGFV